MLTLTERICGHWLTREMCSGTPVSASLELFATEGGTAAMTYISNTLRDNKILMPGDKIAVARPIFTPYLEIHELNDFQLESVYIDADPNAGWQIPEAELDKLLDPKVKAFFLVNPSNPPSVQIDEAGRSVALNHTAGLSTPQQVQMALFSLFAMMDTANNYKAAMMRLVAARHDTLYRTMGLKLPPDPNRADYYTELELEPIGEKLYGRDFVDWLLTKIVPGEMLLRIADEAGIVLMPGGGFGDTHPAARVSLANLNEHDYAAIGTAIRRLLDDYYAKYQQQKGS